MFFIYSPHYGLNMFINILDVDYFLTGYWLLLCSHQPTFKIVCKHLHFSKSLFLYCWSVLSLSFQLLLSLLNLTGKLFVCNQRCTKSVILLLLLYILNLFLGELEKNIFLLYFLFSRFWSFLLNNYWFLFFGLSSGIISKALIMFGFSFLKSRDSKRFWCCLASRPSGFFNHFRSSN